MASKFISHANSFSDVYTIIERTQNAEFLEGYHYHDFYEIQIYYSDDANAELGSIMLGSKIYSLKSGDVVLINMFDPHYINMRKNIPYTRYCLSISPSLMMYICSETSNLFRIYNSNNPCYPHMHMSDQQRDEFLQNYSILQNQLKKFSHGKRFLELAFLFNVITLVYNLFYNDSDLSATDSLHMNTMITLVRYINEHIAEDISLKSLSNVTGYSTYHLCRLFKKSAGTTLNKYIGQKRIENAKALLGSSLDIQSISQQVGFNNYNHFYRSFKQIVGINPTEYRELLQAGNYEEIERLALIHHQS